MDEFRFDEIFSTVTLLTIVGSSCLEDFISNEDGDGIALWRFELGRGGGGGGQ